MKKRLKEAWSKSVGRCTSLPDEAPKLGELAVNSEPISIKSGERRFGGVRGRRLELPQEI